MLRAEYSRLAHTFVLPQLQTTSDPEAFVVWLGKVEILFRGTGFAALALMPKNSTPLDMVQTERLHETFRTSSDYHVFLADCKSVLASGEKLTPKKDVHHLNELGVIYLATLDVFAGVEEAVYNLLKGSVSSSFSHVFPEIFFDGALKTVFLKLVQEFRKPSTAQVFAQRARFLNEHSYKLDSINDPRSVLERISRDAAIINETGGGEFISHIDKVFVLRRAADFAEPYRQVIKIADAKYGSSATFAVLSEAIRNEYLFYRQHRVGKRSPAEVHVATETSDHGDRLNDVPRQESCNRVWVDVPTGNCIQYAIRGKCTRPNCDFKHVKGVPTTTSAHNGSGFDHDNDRFVKPERSDRSQRRGRKPHFDKLKDKHTKSNIRDRVRHSAHNAYENDSSSTCDSESPTHQSEGDSTGDSDSSEEDFRAFQAFKARTKHWKKKASNPKKKAGFLKNHPNKKMFKDKMKEIAAKENTKEESKSALRANLSRMSKEARANLPHMSKEARFHMLYELFCDDESDSE